MDNFSKFESGNFGSYGQPRKSVFRRSLEFIWEIATVAIVALVIILPIRYFLIQPFYVKGASMEPNFYDHEYLIIDEITYRMDEPKRGDIVVFKYPRDPKQYFIKRVVGLPGEKIKIENGRIYIFKNNQYEELNEDYLPQDTLTNLPLRGYGEVDLTDNEYFLLGDNRNESLDSRIFGPVNRSFIIGRTWFRGWPFNRITVFNAPAYNLE